MREDISVSRRQLHALGPHLVIATWLPVPWLILPDQNLADIDDRLVGAKRAAAFGDVLVQCFGLVAGSDTEGSAAS